MKKAMLTIAGMIALRLHSTEVATVSLPLTDETRQIIREYVKEFAEYENPFRRMHSTRYRQISSEWKAIGGDAKMAVFLEMIGEKPDDTDTVNWMMSMFNRTDGADLASYGNQEALEWVRKVLRSEGERFKKGGAEAYLMKKGDERDLDILGGKPGDTLSMRVAGTNVINYIPSGAAILETDEWLGCIPSVTNTGPQGIYVEAILRQCWENLETETRFRGDKPYPFKDKAKIPPELLTLVVWFDDGGNPVCNVDLAKYGLTMPELDVPNRPKGKEKLGIRDQGLGMGDEKSRMRRLWPYALTTALTALATLLLARRRRR
ncbi:MAG: hypothetical protein FWG50_11655 [Kiritimatiellaeota bacterium]|nr:hypothetical protein [Kiritimatiellota bacterium]